MNGWLSVALMTGTLIAVAAILVRSTARRWRDYLLILAGASLLFRPLYDLVSGDVSRYLPVITAAAALLIGKQIVSLSRSRKPEEPSER